ncbi:hypothetical protein JX265_005727 [Neoarthrinium moseri]|uniref:Cytochrome P450 n=1 Tax=Neoarthrinium moseri TaxID=1658444 RepID=A0A9Q0AR09_9PEZI|nr:uncharacterized protein JN550_013393 [Neoarthrinium moseri]KAI1842150.1 hypothetical protein JX266_011683 [Neoarthrinium moseri]KAI1857210.1 hypothetical protein JN550_013393 [Neoarthrinium moseri]KAI1871741.1 hypothetical protein JX265_005727 [Neoarthrinium moseri]
MDTIFQYAAYCVITLLLVVLGSRLVFNPLKAYPGPFLARLTNGYAGWHAIKGDIHLVTYRDHLKYGPVVQQAPNRLVFNTLTAIQDIYLNPRVAKARIYANARFRNTPSVFTALDRADHRRRRRVVGQAISERSMREFEPTMMSQIDVFLVQLLHSSRQGQVVEMTSRCKWLAMDVIGLLAFGASWKTQTEETLRFLPKVFAALNPRVYMFMNWPKTHKIDPGVQWLVRGRIERFRGTTTATAMCTIFYYLSRNPSAYARLASEVRTTFSWGSEIRNGQDLTGCKYLRAVIDESMRICPPTPGVMWRERDPLSNEPLVVDGHVIPPGTLVGVGTYSLMHNPDYFPEPFAFRPERWLEGDAETPEQKETRANMRRAFIPFILGDRSCAGKAVAYLEMSLTVAKTMWYFDFERAPGQAGELGSGRKGLTGGRDRPNEYQLYDWFMADHEGPNLVFQPRGKHWEELT